MKIRVIPRGETTIHELTPHQFNELTDTEWLSHLEFQNDALYDRICSRLQNADQKGKIQRRQKWLGTMYGKEIEAGATANLVIRWSDDKIGYGVFAAEDIYPTMFVGEYTGVVRRKRLLKDTKNNYCFLYPGFTLLKLVIDAKPKGNYTRFINHNAIPNLEPLSVYFGGVMHIVLIAIKPIPKGTELCYDYGPDYWAGRKSAEPIPIKRRNLGLITAH
jgi:hypothetical protein